MTYGTIKVLEMQAKRFVTKRWYQINQNVYDYKLFVP